MNYMRKRSIFDQPRQVGTYPPFDFNTAADEQDQNVTKLNVPPAQGPSRFSSLYADLADEKGGPAQQKFRDFLETGPKREDFQPTKLNRLSAILAGVSDGYKHGGGQGFRTAQDVLDEPYNKAQSDYNLQGKKLEAASGLEEKDMGRRVGILKDIITQDHQSRLDEETARSHRANETNAAERNKRTGLHYKDITDPNTGMSTTNVFSPDGNIGSFSGGKAGRSSAEQLEFNAKDAGGKFDATKKGRIEVAKAGIDERGAQSRTTQKSKFENIKDLLKYKKDNPNNDYIFKNDEASGMVVGVNKHDANDVITTSIQHGKLSDEDKAALGLSNAQKLKTTPGPDTTKTTTTKRDSSGKPTESTTTTTHGTSKVDVIGPNGEVGKMSPEEIDSAEAKKAGWKRKGSK